MKNISVSILVAASLALVSCGTSSYSANGGGGYMNSIYYASSDAVPEAQKAADWVTEAPGGKGCLREAIEKTLKKQDKWVFDPVVYKQRF